MLFSNSYQCKATTAAQYIINIGINGDLVLGAESDPDFSRK